MTAHGKDPPINTAVHAAANVATSAFHALETLICLRALCCTLSLDL